MNAAIPTNKDIINWENVNNIHSIDYDTIENRDIKETFDKLVKKKLGLNADIICGSYLTKNNRT